MSLFTSTTGATGILPPDYGQLVIQPAMDASVFAQVATVVFTVSHNYRIPLVLADPSAAWVAEGAEIAPSDPTLAELVGHSGQDRRTDRPCARRR
jgi:HK97 family phage major capsid protein